MTKEQLKFNKGGQWELIQKASEYTGEKDQDFMSYRGTTLEGRLPEDHGQRGVLHNSSNTRPPKKTSKHKMEGKVPTPVESAAVARNPGMGLN